MFGKALWVEKRRLLKSKGSSYQRQWFLDKVLFSGIQHYLQMQISLWCRWETSSSVEPHSDSHLFSCRGGRGQLGLSSPDRHWVSWQFPAGGTAKFFYKSEFCELEVLNHLVILSWVENPNHGSHFPVPAGCLTEAQRSLCLIFYPLKVQGKKKWKVKTCTRVINWTLSC